jgi:hypothetical protein
MPWHRVDKEHWRNDNDRHLFFDRDSKTVCTEGWSNPEGLLMVVIPIDDLMEFLTENRYPCYPEAKFAALQNTTSVQREENAAMAYELVDLRTKVIHQEEMIVSLIHLKGDVEDAFEQSLQLVQFDSAAMHKQIALRAEAEKMARKAQAGKLEIIDAAQAEITRLREEVKRLKEKYEPQSI